MKLKKFNKKGNIVDIIYISVFLFVFALVLVLSKSIMTDFNDSNMFHSDTAKEVFSENYNDYDGLFNSIFLMVVIGMSIGIVVSAFFINTHPLFYFVAIFIFAISMMISAIFSNTFSEITSDSILSASISGLPFVSHILAYFPYFMLIISIMIAILLYAKGQ